MAIEIGGVEYPINTDFRDCLRVILAFEDPDLTGYEKQMILLDNLYPEPIEDTQAAFTMGMKFLNGGKVIDNDEEGGGPRLYSFEKDANIIFAAFRATHGIDLQNIEYLHWWSFLSLFMDLGADTTFCNLIGLRKRVKNGTASKEEKQAASEMGDMFDLPEPDTRTLEEKDQEAEFMRLIKVGA
jgi:hypothetical protein